MDEPAYSDPLMRWARHLRSRGHTAPLFFHMGYFERPFPSAAPAQGLLLEAQARLHDRLVQMAELREEGDLLDIGCGVGGALTALRSTHPALHTVGLNRSALQLRFMREHSPELQVVRADACALPFGDSSFDHALAVECAFHFPSRRAFVAQCARVLRPGGTLALSDFELAADAALTAEEERVLVRGNAPWPDLHGSGGHCEALGRELGFSLLQRVDVSPHVVATFAGLIARQQPEHMSEVDRAGALMGRLLDEGRLRHVFLAMRRARGPVP